MESNLWDNTLVTQQNIWNINIGQYISSLSSKDIRTHDYIFSLSQQESRRLFGNSFPQNNHTK